MSDNGGAAGRGGPGLLTAGVVIAVAIAAGVWTVLRDTGGPALDELSGTVEPQESAQPAAPVAQETAPASQNAPATELPATPEAPATENAAAEPEAPASEQVAEENLSTGVTVDLPEETAAALAPSVDEVRVDPDGIMIIAGRAEPGSTVSVLVDGEEVASAQTDGRGAFAAVGILSPSDSARVLTLSSDDGNLRTASVADVILAPVAAPVTIAENTATPDPVAVETANIAAPRAETAGGSSAPTEPVNPAAADDETDTAEAEQIAETAQAVAGLAGQVAERVAEEADEVSQSVADALTPAKDIASDQTADAPAAEDMEDTGTPVAINAPAETAERVVDTADTSPETPQTPAIPEPAGAAVAVLKSDEEGVSLLQNAPEPPDDIRLDTIGYSDAGVVQLSGRASDKAEEVRIYLDNRPVLSLQLDAAGNWRGDVPDVDAGVYTLRVDAVGADGSVTSRIETPFKREAPAVLAQAIAGQEGPVRAITVQAGDTLWAIARDRYGEGVLYVRVFEANRKSIRNPDLIYPGQVFDLPDDG